MSERRNTLNMRRLGLWIPCATMLAGCAVGPNYRPPVTTAPAAWSGISETQPAGPTTRPVQVETWWKALEDPILDSLLARCVESNLDLRIATARVREARAVRGTVAADLWPQVNVGGSYNFRGSSINTGSKPQAGAGLGEKAGTAAGNSIGGSLSAGQPVTAAGVTRDVLNQLGTNVIDRKLSGTSGDGSRNQNLFQMGFDASWEIDVFGGLRRGVEAADADVAAVEESRNDVLISLLSEVALNYVQLRGYQRRLAIAQENIQTQRDTVELTQTLNTAGFSSELDVTQARAQLASTRSQVPLLATAIRQSVYQISVLMGRPPASLNEELSGEGCIPRVPGELPVGMPSDLLRRRPDVRVAERQLAAATARIGQAVAALFPTFSLTGSFGPQSRDINHLLDNNSLGFSIGPVIDWPIFDGWRIRSNIEVQNARQEQAVATYEKTVLTAFQDVENALVAFANERVRYETLVEAVEASQKSTELSSELYTRGFAPFLNVLESQRALYISQDAMIQSETTVITDLIALYKALGGGWPTGSESAPTPSQS